MRETLIEIIMQLRAAWRFRWYAMVVAWMVAIAGWTIVVVMPNTYEAKARVYVDTDSILRPLLKGLAVQTDVGQRLRLMTRTLLSRPNLEKVARETDLDIAATTEREKEELLVKLADTIELKSTRKQNLYTISYQHTSPKMSKNVVQSLLTIFVETTLGDTRMDSDTAQRFLKEQIREYESRLIEAENRLTEFKRKHIGTLPGQGGGIFQRLEQTKAEYEQASLELREARYKRDALRKQLKAVQSNENKTGMTVLPIDARILELHKSLDQLLLRFTEQHPDVQEIKEKIRTLEAQKKRESQTGAVSSDSTSGALMVNTALEQLKVALGQSEATLAGIQVRAAEYKRRMQNLRELVKTLPQVETELKRLSRDYEINKANYDSLVSRRESARMSESADAAGDSVKFKIIDPPRLPVLPVKPNRPLLSAVVLFLALAAGGLIAFLMSQLNPVVLDASSLRKISGYPVFGSVDRVWTPALTFKRKLELSAFTIVFMGLVAIFVGVILLNSYGADTYWMKSLRGGL